MMGLLLPRSVIAQGAPSYNVHDVRAQHPSQPQPPAGFPNSFGLNTPLMAEISDEGNVAPSTVDDDRK